MSLLSLVIALVVVGVLLWCVNHFIPMDGRIKTVLNIVVFVVMGLLVLQAFGVVDAIRGVRVPRL